jgi:hypothetical protein
MLGDISQPARLRGSFVSDNLRDLRDPIISDSGDRRRSSSVRLNLLARRYLSACAVRGSFVSDNLRGLRDPTKWSHQDSSVTFIFFDEIEPPG